jgi:hypothetical protein
MTLNLSLELLAPKKKPSADLLGATLLAAAPQSLIAKDFTNLLLGITQKTINEGASEKLPPKTFVKAIRFIAALEQNSKMMKDWSEKVGKFGPLVEIALKDPSSPIVRPFLEPTFRKNPNLEAFADPNLLKIALRIYQNAVQNDLFAPGASEVTIKATLQTPLREALKQYVKQYGNDSSVNKALVKAGEKGEGNLTPLQTLLEQYHKKP